MTTGEQLDWYARTARFTFFCVCGGELNKMVKFCLVCGDHRDVKIHYNAMSCAPCAMFFYRNALRDNRKKCQWSSNCVIIVTNRVTCAECRLQKCYEVGM